MYIYIYIHIYIYMYVAVSTLLLPNLGSNDVNGTCYTTSHAATRLCHVDKNTPAANNHRNARARWPR